MDQLSTIASQLNSIDSRLGAMNKQIEFLAVQKPASYKFGFFEFTFDTVNTAQDKLTSRDIDLSLYSTSLFVFVVGNVSIPTLTYSSYWGYPVGAAGSVSSQGCLLTQPQTPAPSVEIYTPAGWIRAKKFSYSGQETLPTDSTLPLSIHFGCEILTGLGRTRIKWDRGADNLSNHFSADLLNTSKAFVIARP